MIDMTRDELIAHIVKLEKNNRRLKAKVTELGNKPDIHLFLTQCTRSQKKTNSVLKEIVANVENLEPHMVEDFIRTVRRTITILGANLDKKPALNEITEEL